MKQPKWTSEEEWRSYCRLLCAGAFKAMNVYGEVDEMSTASLKVAELAFQGNGAQAERGSS